MVAFNYYLITFCKTLTDFNLLFQVLVLVFYRDIILTE